MNRRIIISLLTTALLSIAPLVEAQQSVKVPRIVYLSTAGTFRNPRPEVELIRQGLRDLGRIEGKDFLFEYRLEGNLDRLPTVLAELVQLKVDVLCVASLTGIRAAKQATKTIPIVMITTADPIAAGLIDSLARPGGNITGLTLLTRELTGKQLELLKEVVPTTSRVGFLLDADSADASARFKEYEVAARPLKMSLQSLMVKRQNPNFERAFQTAVKERVDAFITVRSTLFTDNLQQIADLGIKNRLPSMNEINDYVEAGGLMSYSANTADIYRRAAVYIDKILKGAKPADLPVEQPSKFDFVVNLKTAKQIGLTIPPNVLARADRVIR
jgi:ABC-type uncharacterized transport system substrate-binding protein